QNDAAWPNCEVSPGCQWANEGGRGFSAAVASRVGGGGAQISSTAPRPPTRCQPPASHSKTTSSRPRQATQSTPEQVPTDQPMRRSSWNLGWPSVCRIGELACMVDTSRLDREPNTGARPGS